MQLQISAIPLACVFFVRLSGSARPFEPRVQDELAALEPTPFFVPRTGDRPAGARRGSGGGGGVQRSLEGQYARFSSATVPREERDSQASLPATPMGFTNEPRDTPGQCSANSHTQRKAFREWATLTDIPVVTPNQWATLRRHLRRLSGKEDAVAAMTWEVHLKTKGGERLVIPSRGLLLSHVATAGHHCHHLTRAVVTIIPANRPAILVRLGVDVEDVIRTLRRTSTLEVYVPQQGVRSVLDRNPYDALSSEDDLTTDAEDDGPVCAPPPSRSKAPATPRPTQRERGVRMRALMDVAHQKEMTKHERKQRKVAKRKLAKARRRGDDDSSTSSEVSHNSDEKGTASSSSCTTPSDLLASDT
ncbi:hypothetical protein CYMTET_26762 [Cymbomonas tetramitiformis]|uniref:Uncharacterized protein n=1 Tax=Cymbomonas tetramitiformis TaxID=36881 RepID=A0AAE0KXT9_9CHLO|nr:hypothetical protein CYMTET_26762 [Cymbomonas tetramitiformis]